MMSPNPKRLETEGTERAKGESPESDVGVTSAADKSAQKEITQLGSMSRRLDASLKQRTEVITELLAIAKNPEKTPEERNQARKQLKEQLQGLKVFLKKLFMPFYKNSQLRPKVSPAEVTRLIKEAAELMGANGDPNIQQQLESLASDFGAAAANFAKPLGAKEFKVCLNRDATGNVKSGWISGDKKKIAEAAKAAAKKLGLTDDEVSIDLDKGSILIKRDDPVILEKFLKGVKAELANGNTVTLVDVDARELVSSPAHVPAATPAEPVADAAADSAFADAHPASEAREVLAEADGPKADSAPAPESVIDPALGVDPAYDAADGKRAAAAPVPHRGSMSSAVSEVVAERSSADRGVSVDPDAAHAATLGTVG